MLTSVTVQVEEARLEIEVLLETETTIRTSNILAQEKATGLEDRLAMAPTDLCEIEKMIDGTRQTAEIEIEIEIEMTAEEMR